MPTVTLRKLGGSVVLTVPKKVLSLVDLAAGSDVELTVEGSRLIVEARRKPRYTLNELLANCRKSDFARTKGEREWLSSGSVGKEEL